MIKRFMLLVLFGCFVLGIHAQKSEYVVRSFATNMQSWGQTSKLEYQRNLQSSVMAQRVLEWPMK